MATRLKNCMALELWFDSWQGEEILFFCKMCRPVLGSIYPPIEWVPGALSLGVMWLGMKLWLISNLVHILSVATLGHYAFFISAHQYLYMAFLYIAVYQDNPHADTEATHSKQLRLVSVMTTWMDWCKIYEIWLHMIADVINTLIENVFAWSSLSWHYCVEWHQAHWSLFISINMYS